ncbi:MAG TPA: trypsin-like serine protease [Deltaproteobacteria bacterium]|nr:trypsin-like serine protease [Deltaproteobacteria bacterium]
MKKNKNFTVKRYFWPLLVLLILVVGAIWTNAGVMGHLPYQGNTQPNRPVPLVNQPPAPQGGASVSPQTAVQVQEGISHVVSLVRPAVVAVTTPLNNGMPAASGLTRLNPYQGSSGPVGSGFIIDPRGYVLTTFQTVGRTKQVRISLFSGGRRHYDADVMGVDSQTDLALLKIRSNETFPAIVLGNSDLVEVGDIVFAIGSPFGFSRSVTMGIVSSNRRGMTIDGVRYPDMIQTDATINEGNDGGPLINVRGEAVGVNMAYYKPNNQYSGISFAIPINSVLASLQAAVR